MNTTLTIDMTHLPNSIPLGRCGENHTVICFDCTSYLETYGEGSAALLFQPAQGSMHPVVVEQTGALVTWRVSASDTAASGSGLCELSWYVDDMLAKSQQMSTVVYAALSERADTACQAASRPWMDQIVQASANAQRAQAAAETAQSIAVLSTSSSPAANCPAISMRSHTPFPTYRHRQPVGTLPPNNMSMTPAPPACPRMHSRQPCSTCSIRSAPCITQRHPPLIRLPLGAAHGSASRTDFCLRRALRMQAAAPAAKRRTS